MPNGQENFLVILPIQSLDESPSDVKYFENEKTWIHAIDNFETHVSICDSVCDFLSLISFRYS